MSFKIAIFTLNQWALDFAGNLKRVLESIYVAAESGALIRSGPELELCGYSLEDALFEDDTLYHCWSGILDIIEKSIGIGLIIDVGMPVRNSTLYNCRVIIYEGKILFIRAKTSLAKDGIYREHRHFTPWDPKLGTTAYRLPKFVSEKTKQQYVPFGAGFVLDVSKSGNSCDTIRIGWEICQELWDCKTVSSDLYQQLGCHLIFNSSASYWELRKLNVTLDLITGLSLRSQACYAYSNCVGCDGQRYVFPGRSCIFDRGQLAAMSSTSSEIFREVEMITHVVNMKVIEEARSQMGFKVDRPADSGRVWNLRDPPMDVAAIVSSFNIFYLDLDRPKEPQPSLIGFYERKIQPEIKHVMRFEQEIDLYVSLWLWDYLRRSQMKGFIIPLSGGLDSSSVAVLVYRMCNYVYANLKFPEIKSYFEAVHDIKKSDIETELTSPSVICKRILKCVYLSTRYSSQETFNRSRMLANAIGAEFLDQSIQEVYSSFRASMNPDGSKDEVSILDQNLQARLRMTAIYYLSDGNRIVLATGNVDEAILGYLTKYDCSSADINPIGGLCKDDLRSYLKYCCKEVFVGKDMLVQTLEDIIAAPPSAELTGADQRDEDEIGLTYDEISILGKVRRGIYGCSGPRGAFETLWLHRNQSPFCDKIRCFKQKAPTIKKSRDLASLVKKFYQRYSRNRHKLTVLTPALHTETYSPDDNRYDHRHFLYAPWTEQFNAIDKMVNLIELEAKYRNYDEDWLTVKRVASSSSSSDESTKHQQANSSKSPDSSSFSKQT